MFVLMKGISEDMLFKYIYLWSIVPNLSFVGSKEGVWGIWGQDESNVRVNMDTSHGHTMQKKNK